MKRENWSKYVAKTMSEEKAKDKKIGWEGIERARAEYIKIGRRLCADAVPLVIALDVLRAKLNEYYVDADQEHKTQAMFLAESWIREGYEQANNGQ